MFSSSYFWMILGIYIICCPFRGTNVILAGGTLFRRYKGIDVQSSCQSLRTNVRSLIACGIQCEQSEDCVAGSYHIVRKTCCLSDVRAFEMNVTYVEDDDSWYYQLETDHVVYGGWTLVFRALGGSNIPLLDAWINYGHHDDAPVGRTNIEPGCLTFNRSKSCGAHFRSQYLDTWDSLNIQEVALRLYNDGAQVVEVVFNGTGSTVTSWMKPSRLLHSPWDDATTSSSNYNYFGVNKIQAHRRFFFINKSYHGCGNDSGWLCATDTFNTTAVPCPWEDRTMPAFTYSGEKSVVRWQDNDASVGTADILAVFVKI